MSRVYDARGWGGRGREWPRKVVMLRFSIKQKIEGIGFHLAREILCRRGKRLRKFLCILKLCVQGLNVNKKRCHVKNILNRLLYPLSLCSILTLVSSSLQYNILFVFFFFYSCSNKTTHAISLFLFSYYISSCLLI